jgi:hypothetical protein
MGTSFQNNRSLVAIHRRQIIQAIDDDREWFELNPERRFRLRPLIHYEFNRAPSALSDGWAWRVLVDQNLAGIRVRIPVWVPVLLPREGATDEHLNTIYHQLSSKTLDSALEAAAALNDAI